MEKTTGKIDPQYLAALRLILEQLSDRMENWAVTGSLGMALQGVPVEVHDIDLQSDRSGAYLMGKALSAYCVEPVREVQSEKMWSHLGRFEIQGVKVDVIGDIRKKGADGWDEPVALNHVRRYVHLEGNTWVPVLSLAYEAEAYARMGRAEKAELLRRWIDQHPEDRPEAITNFIEISPELSTGGQPLPEQIAALGQHGFTAVISLARTDLPISLREQGELVRAAGMEYVSIPVVWTDPRREDLERFYAAMDARRGQKVFVHCVMNFRVSSFVYLYRVNRMGVPVAEARRDLLKGWKPDERWGRFIEENTSPRPS